MRLLSPSVLRQAMNAAGVSIPQLARRTKQIDPASIGVSQALIGFLVSEGKTHRDTCTAAKARLIAEALDTPLDALFAATTSTSRGPTTAQWSTRHRRA